MPVQTKAQVLSLLQEFQQELQRFRVSRCGVFGSFARGSTIHEQSDVDILVVFEPEQKTFDNFMHLSFFLEELFGRTVDLITLELAQSSSRSFLRLNFESLSPYIGPHILDEVDLA